MTLEEFMSSPLTGSKVQILRQNIFSLRILAASLSAPLGGDRVQTSGATDRVGRIVADIADAEREMEREIMHLTRLRLDALELIKRLPEPDQSVIRLRYISGMKWEDVAEATHYEISWAYRIGRRAIDMLFPRDAI